MLSAGVISWRIQATVEQSKKRSYSWYRKASNHHHLYIQYSLQVLVHYKQKKLWKLQAMYITWKGGGRHFHNNWHILLRGVNYHVPQTPANFGKTYDNIKFYNELFGYWAQNFPNHTCRTSSHFIQVGFIFTQDTPDLVLSINSIYPAYLLLDSCSTITSVCNK